MNSEIIDRPEKSIDKSNSIRKMDPGYFYNEIEKILDRYCKKNNLSKEKNKQSKNIILLSSA